MKVDSSETVSFLRPLARRAANTLRPLAVAILARNPCLLILLRREGWKVLFIAIVVSCFLFLVYFAVSKGTMNFQFCKRLLIPLARNGLPCTELRYRMHRPTLQGATSVLSLKQVDLPTLHLPVHGAQFGNDGRNDLDRILYGRVATPLDPVQHRCIQGPEA